MSVRSAATVAACSLAVVTGAIAAVAHAQTNYPSRPIRMLIPFPAGGAADLIGRTIGERLAAELGQSVVVDNRPGAAGVVATEMLARAEPDGHTVLIGTPGAIAVGPWLNSKLPFDPRRDLLPVTRVGEIINVMVVPTAIGTASVREFVDWARKRPGEVRFGSSGNGQTDHLAAEFFGRLTQLKLQHVPYKGGGPALVEMVSGSIQLMFATYIVAMPHIKSGRLRAVAVVTPQRQPLLPDLPAVAETVQGFGLSNWNGAFVPAKTPPAVADRLFAAINQALKAPELKTRQNAAGIEPGGSASRAEFHQFVRDEIERWGRIVKETGIKAE